MGEQRKTEPRASDAPFTEQELGAALNTAFDPNATQLAVEPVSSPRLIALVQEELQTLDVRVKESADGEIPTPDTEDTSPMLPQAEGVLAEAASPAARWQALLASPRAALAGGGLLLGPMLVALVVLALHHPRTPPPSPAAVAPARKAPPPSAPEPFVTSSSSPFDRGSLGPSEAGSPQGRPAVGPSGAGPTTATQTNGGKAVAEEAPRAARRIKDTLEPADVLRVVSHHKDALVSCVEQERSRTPDLEGVLVMHIAVNPSGRVGSAKAKTPAFEGSTLEGCVGQEIRRWTFPRHRTPVPPFDFPFKL